MNFEQAPLCVQCDSECPNGIKGHGYLVVCQNPVCPNYGIFQAGKTTDEEILSYIRSYYYVLSQMGWSNEQIKIKKYYL